MGVISPEIRESNEQLLGLLANPDAATRKQASEAVSDYLRLKNRENGFATEIIPPVTITAANLDRQQDTPDPVVINDIEPESAGAYSVPFGTGPMTQQIEAGRYPVFLKRIESWRYESDVARLLTWNMDIREILKDFLLKDIQKVEDTNLMRTVEAIVGAQPINTVNPLIGACQWTTQGPLDRNAYGQAMKGLASTNRHLNPVMALVNNVTVWDIWKLTPEEIGDSLSQELFVNGLATRKVGGLDLKITIKTDLVKDHDMYHFAGPKYLGDFLILEDIVMSTELINYNLQFFAYKMVGMAIKNIAAVCKVSFTDYAVDWATGDPWGSATNLPVTSSSVGSI